ncbi:MAG: pseudouridine synthase [Lachnospiraceae bacterium]|nr:pseudouridine synthase [Lachnospiraceae bacterium]
MEKNQETVRLNKYLAECGVCSRRDGDKLIASGKVTVDGRTAVMGERVTGMETIAVQGKILSGRNQKIVLAYYKPVGVTCTERDKYAEKTVTEEIGYPVRVTYAGRLDKDSEGLLLLSNDGELIRRMMKASEKHEKEYRVRTKQTLTEEFLQKMSGGVYLKELDVTTRPCTVEQIDRNTFRIVLTQGLNRQIRRMCRELGFDVTALKRVRVLSVTLDGLAPGEYRELDREELQKLYQMTGMVQHGSETD